MGCEVFVTGGFKEELKRRKKFEEELETQDRLDEMKAAERMENGAGFADMYRNLLNGGLASSRGGEKIREQAAPREELKPEELVADRVERKTETKDEVKEEAKEELKEEDEGGSAHGVKDVEAPPSGTKRAREEEEKEQREEKTMSARERYLARKKV